MDPAAVGQVATKLIADDEEDSHPKQQPVQPGVVKAHLVGDQRPDVGVDRVVGCTDRDHEDDAEQDPAVLEQAELLAESALKLRGIPWHQPDQTGEDDDGQSGDHPEAVVPGEGGTDHRPDRDPDDRGDAETGEDPGNQASPFLPWGHETGHHQDHRDDRPSHGRGQDPREKEGVVISCHGGPGVADEEDQHQE